MVELDWIPSMGQIRIFWYSNSEQRNVWCSIKLCVMHNNTLNNFTVCKQIGSSLFKMLPTNYPLTHHIALKNLQGSIWHKTQPNQTVVLQGWIWNLVTYEGWYFVKRRNHEVALFLLDSNRNDIIYLYKLSVCSLI